MGAVGRLASSRYHVRSHQPGGPYHAHPGGTLNVLSDTGARSLTPVRAPGTSPPFRPAVLGETLEPSAR
jgi:hypothetical protein